MTTRNETEHEEQKNLIAWWAFYSRHMGFDERLLFSIPNAAKRSFAVANIMRSEGLRSGVPDLFLSIARGGFHGLFIEMKREKGGVVSLQQKEFIEELRKAGYMCEVCKGFEAARELIEKYLFTPN